MRLEQLYYLSTLSKYPSINIASSHLNLTQQSLSNSIKSLENELNCTILIRTHRGIFFTPEGEKVLQVSKHMIQEWEDLCASLTPAEKNQPTSLRILSSSRVISGTLIKYCNQFIKAYSDIPLFCDAESNNNIIHHYYDFSDYDLIFIQCIKKGAKMITKLPPYLKFHPVKNLRFYLITNKVSDLAHQKTIEMDCLKGRHLRMYSDPEQISTQAQKEDYNDFMDLLNIKHNLIYSDSISYCMQGLLDNDFDILVTDGLQINLFSHQQTIAIPITMDYQFQSGYLLPDKHTLTENAKKFISLFDSLQNSE